MLKQPPANMPSIVIFLLIMVLELLKAPIQAKPHLSSYSKWGNNVILSRD